MGVRHKFDHQAGFSLIEIMIVLAIVSIIGMVALPSYSAHICKVDRRQAKADLLAFSQELEKFYGTNNFRYLNSDGTSPDLFPLYSPSKGSAAGKKYDFTLTIPNTDGSYSISAARSSGSCQDGTLQLTSTGVRTWTRNGATQNSWEE